MVSIRFVPVLWFRAAPLSRKAVSSECSDHSGSAPFVSTPVAFSCQNFNKVSKSPSTSRFPSPKDGGMGAFQAERPRDLMLPLPNSQNVWETESTKIALTCANASASACGGRGADAATGGSSQDSCQHQKNTGERTGWKQKTKG